MTALHRANYMNLTDSAACCCVIIVAETFTGPDSMSYFMNLHRTYDALRSTIFKFNTFPGAVIYI